jgi:hypothetical protein
MNASRSHGTPGCRASRLPLGHDPGGSRPCGRPPHPSTRCRYGSLRTVAHEPNPFQCNSPYENPLTPPHEECDAGEYVSIPFNALVVREHEPFGITGGTKPFRKVDPFRNRVSMIVAKTITTGSSNRFGNRNGVRMVRTSRSFDWSHDRTRSTSCFSRRSHCA